MAEDEERRFSDGAGDALFREAQKESERLIDLHNGEDEYTLDDDIAALKNDLREIRRLFDHKEMSKKDALQAGPNEGELSVELYKYRFIFKLDENDTLDFAYLEPL